MKKLLVYISIFIFSSVFFRIVNPILKNSLLQIFVNLGVPQWLLPLAYIIPSILIFVLVFLVFTKFLIVTSLPKTVEFLPVHPDEFPELDLNSLEKYTRDLESLGFTKLMDYKLGGEAVRGLARLFAHPEFYCFAEVNQMFPSGKKPTSVQSVITSYLEQDWSLSTTDRQTLGFNSGLIYMMRRPRSLWNSEPLATPTELVEIHLKRRQQISIDLGVSILTDISADAYLAEARKAARDRKEVIKRKNIVVGFWEAFMFAKNPRLEWMGEYARIADRKKS